MSRVGGHRAAEADATPSISLIITTYNRAALLREALESIAASTIEPPSSVEVIVVDNNSADATAAVVDTIQRANFPFRLSYLKETRQGTSWARNAGIEAARGEYIAFMDDDQRIDPAYLQNIRAAFKETGAVCVGGPVRYYNAENVPGWLAPVLKHKGQLEHGEHPKELGPADQRLGGGNMVFKTSALSAIGNYDTRLGHHGDQLGGNEDWEIQDRAIANGHTVAYHPKLVQYHYLRPERYRKHYWRKLYFAYGRSLYLRGNWTNANLFFGAPRTLWWILATRDIPAFLASFLTLSYPRIFSKQLEIWLRVGKIYEARQAKALRYRVAGSR